MRILIVEDDNYKSTALKAWLKTEYPQSNVESHASYRDGCIAAQQGTFDMLILDMSLPVRSQTVGNCTDTIVNGGELIIRELIDDQIDFTSVILTQYETFNGETIETIEQRLKQLCGASFCGCVSYNSQDDSWKNNLKIIIDNNVKGINC